MKEYSIEALYNGVILKDLYNLIIIFLHIANHSVIFLSRNYFSYEFLAISDFNIF